MIPHFTSNAANKGWHQFRSHILPKITLICLKFFLEYFTAFFRTVYFLFQEFLFKTVHRLFRKKFIFKSAKPQKIRNYIIVLKTQSFLRHCFKNSIDKISCMGEPIAEKFSCDSSSSSLGFSVVALGLTSLYWLANLTFCTRLQLLKKVHVQELASE